MNRYDLVIVGGGMSGLTLLASLQPAIEQGLSVALVDPAPKPTQTSVQSPSFDDRATALSAGAIQAFEALDIKGLAKALSNITRIEVSDQGHLGYHSMVADDFNFAQFGAVISNRALGGLLWQRTQNLAIDWHFDTQVEQIQPTSTGHFLTLSTQETLTASMILLCDGGRSGLTQQLGVHTKELPFQASARVAVVKTSRHHNGTAFERFTPSGPIALLPFGDYSALVWTIPDQLKNHLPQSRAEAMQWLNEHFGQRLGHIEQLSEWVEYPLVEKTVSTHALHNLLILGNSAATLHPVAGQGFNLAIRGLMRSAQAINACWQHHRRTPNFAELSDIAEGILSDQQKTVMFSRELIQLFNSKNPLIQLGRGLGLGSLDRHPSLSKTFALASMGLLANTPINTLSK